MKIKARGIVWGWPYPHSTSHPTHNRELSEDEKDAEAEQQVMVGAAVYTAFVSPERQELFENELKRKMHEWLDDAIHRLQEKRRELRGCRKFKRVS